MGILDTQLINVEGYYITKVHRKESKIPITGYQKYQSDIRETSLQEIYTEQKILHLI